MASGGGDSRRHPYSEPRNRSQIYARLLNQDDERLVSAASTNSGIQEDRLNNWVSREANYIDESLDIKMITI